MLSTGIVQWIGLKYWPFAIYPLLLWSLRSLNYNGIIIISQVKMIVKQELTLRIVNESNLLCERETFGTVIFTLWKY